jgi:predicted NAD-dependent protein-ADP-ribosyltransferase YbiA (DUF1768 family)
MVFSHLNKLVEYQESREIDPEDIDYDAAVYEIEIYGQSYLVALGKPKYTFSTKYDVVYFPIYLVRKNKIRGKIGVYEVERTRIISLMDKEKDVKIERLGDPLFFEVTTEEYIKKTDAVYVPPVEVELEKEVDEPVIEEIKELVEEEVSEEPESESESEEEDNVLSLQKNKKEKKGKVMDKEREEEDKRLTKDTVFVKDSTSPSQKTWPEESDEESKKYHQEYEKSKSTNDNWVQTFFRNKNYGILKNEGGGDCLFATVRDAFEEIGYHTTVLKLRTLISQEVDLKQFEERMKLYREVMYGVENTEQVMEEISKKNQSLKKQTGGGAMDKEFLKEMVAGAKELKKKYTVEKEKHEVDKELLEEFGFMKNIKTVDDLKMYIKTSSFWADTWAISTLERLLDVKIIILEDTTDKDAVMQCGQLNDDLDTFSPKYYLIVNYTMNGNHYELITYQKKRLFSFQEIPYDVKILIVNKCMERAAGPYAIIPAFRQFQQDLGVEVEQGETQTALPLEEGLCDDDTRFVFHASSDSSKKPGQGIQEKINATRLKEFAGLMKKPPLAWRQQLDDTWDTAAFEVDHLRWSSVSHYLLAFPFKTLEPETYKEFSLNGTKKEIAEKLDTAKEALEYKKGKKGVFYDKKKKIEDPTNDEMENARKEALFAKFSQNADLTTMLLSTGKACLHKFRRGKESEMDVLLMMVRRKLGIEKKE